MYAYGAWLGVLMAIGCCAPHPALGADREAMVAAAASEFREVSFRSLDDGARARLADLSGRVVLVNFWASWCVPCRREMPVLERLYREFNSRGFEIFAIAVYDELIQAQKFMRRQRLTFPMYFDDQQHARRVFGVTVVPQTLLIGRDGAPLPIPDPMTGVATARVHDPQVWEHPATREFISRLLDAPAAR